MDISKIQLSLSKQMKLSYKNSGVSILNVLRTANDILNLNQTYLNIKTETTYPGAEQDLFTGFLCLISAN